MASPEKISHSRRHTDNARVMCHNLDLRIFVTCRSIANLIRRVLAHSSIGKRPALQFVVKNKEFFNSLMVIILEGKALEKGRVRKNAKFAGNNKWGFGTGVAEKLG